MRRQYSGFTLIEVLIVMAIIGILAAIGYPSYQQYVLKSHRADAQTVLLTLANAQEHYLADNGVYTSDLSALGLKPSARYDYQINLTQHAKAFELSALAKGLQLADEGCLTMSVNHIGQRNVQQNNADECWL